MNMDIQQLQQLLNSLKGDSSDGHRDAGEDTLSKLHSCFDALTERNEFAVGDLVQWKAVLKNKKLPEVGRPAVVLQKLDSPVFDDESRSSGSPYFREPLDIVLGLIDEDGDFLMFHYDSRRFQPYSPE